jgi:peptidoglycan hydrolase CwlO-like protein
VIPVRLLPLLNAVGCVVLAGFILVQWFDGKNVEKQLHEARSQTIVEKNARMEIEQRAKLLQSDVEGLKASIVSIQASAEIAEKKLAEQSVQFDATVKGLEDAQGKVKEWEDAVKARDEAIALRDTKLKEATDKVVALNASLVSTRKRLDEAVAELKKAGAR